MMAAVLALAVVYGLAIGLAAVGRRGRGADSAWSIARILVQVDLAIALVVVAVVRAGRDREAAGQNLASTRRAS